jgi:ribosome-associated translation inhibitor RaiA
VTSDESSLDDSILCGCCNVKPKRIRYQTFSYLYCQDCKVEVVEPKEVIMFTDDHDEFYAAVEEAAAENEWNLFMDLHYQVWKGVKERREKKTISSLSSTSKFYGARVPYPSTDLA